MWEFPGACRRDGESAPGAARRAVLDVAPVGSAGDARAVAVEIELEPLCTVIHAFTHVRVVYEAFIGHADPRANRRDQEAPGMAWVGLSELGDYALPKAQQRIAAALATWRSSRSSG